jgi:hypothetical protein
MGMSGFFGNVAFRVIAVLVVGLTVATTINAAEMTLPAAGAPAGLPSQPAQPAGCHSHALPASAPAPVVPTPSTPAPSAPASPAPRSYQCCGTGHQIAVPYAAFSLRLLFAPLYDKAVDDRFSVVAHLHFPFEPLLAPSGGPPGSVSLRI